MRFGRSVGSLDRQSCKTCSFVHLFVVCFSFLFIFLVFALLLYVDFLFSDLSYLLFSLCKIRSVANIMHNVRKTSQRLNERHVTTISKKNAKKKGTAEEAISKWSASSRSQGKSGVAESLKEARNSCGMDQTKRGEKIKQ